MKRQLWLALCGLLSLIFLVFVFRMMEADQATAQHEMELDRRFTDLPR